MKLSVSAYRAHSSAHKKILSSSYQLNYGSTGAAAGSSNRMSLQEAPQLTGEPSDGVMQFKVCGPGPPAGHTVHTRGSDPCDEDILGALSPPGTGGTGGTTSLVTSREDDDDSSNVVSTESKSPGQRPLAPASSIASNSDSCSLLEAADEDDDDEDNIAQGHVRGQESGTSRISGVQSWRNVRAVMAYYHSLRKIKRTKSNQRWMKLRTTVQISSAISTIQKKPPLKREDSFLARFSTRQIPATQETVEDTGSEGCAGDQQPTARRRRRYQKSPRTVVNPDENFYFYWLMLLTVFVLYNLWTLIVRQSFPELQILVSNFWFTCDCLSDAVFVMDLVVQLRTGYLEQGLMVYDSKKLAGHYLHSRAFMFDLGALVPLDLLQLRFGPQPMLRFPRFLKVYRAVNYYYMVESRTVWPNLWRVVNLIHILLILAHWFGCFYFLLSEAEGFQGDWVYPHRPGDYATLTRKYLGSLYWSTLTLTTIGDLPTPETNVEPSESVDGPKSLPRRGLKSRLLQFRSNGGYVFTIVSYLIGVFIFATIVGQVGNVITNRNANRLEFERLLDGAKTYMRHHKVPGGMKRRVLRWYDYSWSRGRIQGGGDINTALGLLPDKLKTELALHVNLSVLKKVTIFQECQPEFLHDLVLKMKAYIFTPGDSICRKGEVAREMFIIADGILEVISETGRVLTTMAAGDFFGEIGILNLDGLNKRTADVRSVGYSELFSLSREDVLAAMKDYPEAQEILQSLGRKRLMEVRNVAKRHSKGKAHVSHHPIVVSHADGSDNSAPKRIVDKLRSDVKGLRDVLRKSRTGRRSDESVELQPLHATGGKGMLRRMPRVKSDEFNGESDDHMPTDEKVGSPIGAGLPLLSRLRLLKEKQDREERAAKSPPLHHLNVPISRRESIQEEPQVIGAGLPLLQRLLLLKAKEDRQDKQHRDTGHRTQLTVNTTAANLHALSGAQGLSPTSPTVKSSTKLLSPISKTAGETSTLSVPAKSIKLSFKDRIKNMQGGDQKITGSDQSSAEKKSVSPIKNVSNTFKDKLKLLQSSNAKDESQKSETIVPKHKFSDIKNHDSIDHKPWTKLKKATILTDSLNNISFDMSLQHYKVPNIVSSKNIHSKKASSASPSDMNMNKTNKNMNKDSQRQHLTCVPNIKQSRAKSDTVLTTSGNKIQDKSKALEEITIKPNLLQLRRETKSYFSVDDLSPEYSGLPFVKKLKILNERQKLAELESVIKTRSSSLDCTDTSSENSVFGESLTRSRSETSALGISKQKGNIQACLVAQTVQVDQCHIRDEVTAPSPLPAPSPSEATSPAPAPGVPQPPPPPVVPHFIHPPLSPESNETAERRNLKSILKKISEDTQPESTELNSSEFKKLLRAPTIEGYAARHSKLQKSVTFNRHTLTSPPDSANLCEIGNSLFPILSSHDNSKTFESNHSQNVTINSPFITSSDLAPSQNPIFDAISDRHSVEISSEMNFLSKPPTSGIELTPVIDDLGFSTVKPKLTFISARANQRKLMRGSLEDQEYFGEVLVGIKQVIQGHLQEVQGKFHDRFRSLELEVRRRDEIISQLQNRIQELEEPGSAFRTGGIRYAENSPFLQDNSGSESPSFDQPFMRGDSLDTIFMRSPSPRLSEHSTSSLPVRHRQRYSHHRNSPRRRSRRSWEEHSDQENLELQDLPRSITPECYTDSPPQDYALTTSSITGNVTKVYNTNLHKQESVVVDIDDSPDTDTDFEIEEEEEEEEDEDLGANYDYLNRRSNSKTNDWEVQMLAKELDKREYEKKHKKLKKDSSSEREDISSEQYSDGEYNKLLSAPTCAVPDTEGSSSRRIQMSESESDGSGVYRRVAVTRASSLDQHRPQPPRVTPRLSLRTRSVDVCCKTKKL